MHRLLLLLGSCFVIVTVLASRSIRPYQEALSDEYIHMPLLPRGSSRGSSPVKDPERGLLSSSQAKGQKSPHLAEEPQGKSSSVQATSPTNRGRSPPQAGPSKSKEEGSSPPRSTTSRNRGVHIGTGSMTRNGPIRLPRSQARGISTSEVANRQRSPEPQPPNVYGLVGGHPNSMMVVAKGPAYLEAQKSTGDKEWTHVPAGHYNYIHMEDKVGGYALGRPDHGGIATAASTGNAVAAYASLGRYSDGFIETYNGPSKTFSRVHPGTDKRLYAKGDGTGRINAAALGHIQDHGQVTAVALEKEKEHTRVKKHFE